MDDELWAAAHEHLNQQRERYHKQPGANQRPNVKDSKYLLTGFCACGECGAGLYVKTCAHGSPGRRFRVPFLHCLASNRGTVCTTWHKIRHDVASEHILRELKHLLNQPTFIEATVQYLADLGWLAKGDDTLERRSELRKQVDVLGKEIQNLTNALAEGRAVKSVVAALQDREQEKEVLQRELERLTIIGQARPTNLSKVSDKVRARFGELLDQLSHHSDVARDVLRTVLTKRIVFKPAPEAKVVRFFGELNIGRLFGVVPLERVETPTLLASPTQIDHEWIAKFEGFSAERAA